MIREGLVPDRPISRLSVFHPNPITPEEYFRQQREAEQMAESERQKEIKYIKVTIGVLAAWVLAGVIVSQFSGNEPGENDQGGQITP